MVSNEEAEKIVKEYQKVVDEDWKEIEKKARDTPSFFVGIRNGINEFCDEEYKRLNELGGRPFFGTLSDFEVFPDLDTEPTDERYNDEQCTKAISQLKKALEVQSITTMNRADVCLDISGEFEGGSDLLDALKNNLNGSFPNRVG